MNLAGRWITLPMPPTISKYYRPGADLLAGMHKLTKEGQRYKRTVYYELRKLGIIRPLEGRLRLEVGCHFATKAHSDLSNRLKCLEDSLQTAGLYKDDWQIDDLHVMRGHPIKFGEVKIRVTELSDLEQTNPDYSGRPW